MAGISQAAPIAITGPGTYSQNFDTLANSGTANAWADDSTIAGWYSQRSGTGTTYAADVGTATAGNLYSYGSASATERALGSIGSGTAGSFSHGVLLQNTSGGSVTINSLAYIGEQWRKSGVTTAQVVTLWYQVSSGPITALTPTANTGWTAITAGDFSSPVNTTGAGALDGNAAANRTAISIDPNISVPDGNYVMIRWKDLDHSGSDHGLAIDDVSLGWIGSTAAGLGLSATPTTIVENAGAGASTGTVTIPAALGTDLVVDLASSDTTEAVVPATVTITTGNTSATFPIDAIDDLFADGSQLVTLTASTSGYISAQTGVTVDNDTDAPIMVSVTPDIFAENAGNGVATGTVTLAANVTSDLTVNLSSNDTTEANVPSSVIITTGTNSATFAVDASDDGEVDGTRNVTIQATATGYSSGSALIQVTDFGDTPPAATLSPGAIAFTGFNADGNDDVAFVALAPIAETDFILLTDLPYNGSGVGAGGAFSGTEGVIKWTAPAGGVAQGTVVTLSSLSTAGRTASVGTLVSVSGSFNLGASGETLYAYQGATLVPTGFLAVIATQTSDPTTGTGLSAEHIINLPANIDIAAYTGSRSSQTTFNGYLSLLGDVGTNWITQDGSGDQSIDTTAPDVPFDATAFTLATASTYDTWNDNLANQTPSEDYDGDGLDNGTEYFMGTAGDAFTPNPGIVAGAVTWDREAGTTITDWRVDVSTDLVNWENALTNYSDNLDTTDSTKVVFTMPTTPGKFFVRLRVEP